MTDGDAAELGRALAEILRLGETVAETGNVTGFRIYKLARNALEIMAFDRISRDTLAKLSSGRESFQGWEVSEVVLDHMRNNRKINAIKEFRGESGLGLKEAKDWVEAYMIKHNMMSPF
jgi:ribosomal protein L7/L12